MRAPAVTAGPCSAETIRCTDARDYRAELRPCCRGHLVEMSRRISEAFDLAGVTYWIDYGTLLGAVRNPLTTWADYPWLPQAGKPEGPLAPGIVPHDKDVDWGVLHSDWRLAVRALQRGVPDLQQLIRVVAGQIKVRLSRTNKTNLDLFFWVERMRHGEKTGRLTRKRWVDGVDRFKGKDFERDQLFPLHRIPWEGLMLPAPKDPERWLEFRYGPNWRTPIAANNDGVPRR